MTEAKGKRKIFDGRYDILSIVGRGACSVVYHARHASPPVSDVALKVLLNKKGDRTNADRLRKEALAMVSSRHRYVIRLDDFHSVGDLCYLSMEFAPESDLRKFAQQKGGTVDLVRAERFLLQSTEALGFIHRAGIIHRDIKPDNILVMNENEIRLGDFGVAVLPGEESSLEELQRGVGTMDYMAPEVLDGTRYDQRSDVYALGVTFYELITGKHPFAGAPLMEQIEARRDEKVAPITTLAPTTPGYLANVIMRAMSFDREQRYPTGREMLQAILVGKSEGDKATEKPASRKAPAAEQKKPAENEKKPAQPTAQQSKPAPRPPVAAKPTPTKAPELPPQVVAAKKTAQVVPATEPEPSEKPREQIAVGQSATGQPPKRTIAPLTPSPAQPKPAAKVEEPKPVLLDIDEPKDDETPIAPFEAASNDDGLKSEMPPDEKEDLDPAPGSSLPGIGLKKEPVHGLPSPMMGSSVRLKDPGRRETVTVPPSEVGITRELSNARPTVTIPKEHRQGSGGLAAAAMMDADSPEAEEERQTPTVGFAGGPAVQELTPKGKNQSRRENGEAIQGINGKFQKVKEINKRDSRQKGDAKMRAAAPTIHDPSPFGGLVKKLAIAVLGLGVLYIGLSLLLNTETVKKLRGTHSVASGHSNNAETQGIPLVKDAELSFPNLPPGLYSGKLVGITPGYEIPLAIVSLPQQQKLSFVLGLPGWTPTLVDIPDPAENEEDIAAPLLIASNGMIIELTGQVVDGNLTGSFRDKITGDEGSWSATPIRGEAQ